MRTKLFLLCLLAVACANAQLLTLEHTFALEKNESFNFVTYDYDNMKSLYYSDNITDLNGKAYYTTRIDREAGTYTIKYYGMDYSLISTKVFNLPSLDHYMLEDFSLTRTLFDDDESTYEYIIRFRGDYSSDEYSNQKLVIFSESGDILYDFGTASWFYANSALHIYNNEFRFIVNREETNPSDPYTPFYYRDIYRVNNKQYSEGLKNIPVSQLPRKVIIDNHMYIITEEQVIDMQGRVLQVLK